MNINESEKNLIQVGENYCLWSEKLQNAEEKYKLIRAEAMESAVVANLPNQAMREAKLDVVLQEDDRFKQLYMDYLTAKLEAKKAWIMFDVGRELNENARALLNNLTFGKEVNHNG